MGSSTSTLNGYIGVSNSTGLQFIRPSTKSGTHLPKKLDCTQERCFKIHQSEKFTMKDKQEIKYNVDGRPMISFTLSCQNGKLYVNWGRLSTSKAYHLSPHTQQTIINSKIWYEIDKIWENGNYTYKFKIDKGDRFYSKCQIVLHNDTKINWICEDDNNSDMDWIVSEPLREGKVQLISLRFHLEQSLAKDKITGALKYKVEKDNCDHTFVLKVSTKLLGDDVSYHLQTEFMNSTGNYLQFNPNEDEIELDTKETTKLILASKKLSVKGKLVIRNVTPYVWVLEGKSESTCMGDWNRAFPPSIPPETDAHVEIEFTPSILSDDLQPNGRASYLVPELEKTLKVQAITVGDDISHHELKFSWTDGDPRHLRCSVNFEDSERQDMKFVPGTIMLYECIDERLEADISNDSRQS